MIGFEYYNPAKIVFGEDSEKKLKDLLKEYKVKSLLLVYSGDFIRTLGIKDVIEEAVRDLGIDLYENVQTNENFFIGKQWEGVRSNGLPTPVFNFLKRVHDRSGIKTTVRKDI